ncbi:putative P-loop ATPase [Parabacteroides sp. PF5-5]|uniref:VapE domain-containing protein n=1 Tax=unclassified Parabacteroides TaxID=2649774 RepID=UPI0024752A69|nr:MULTISPECIES: VapE domain-containing protein [unclassified Parabacteroides]MDH6306475.1 putative P-loop ATPase [Parabacteroides sp. PH5-39]MDH6317373.1 putative P-loop ATPase [Parabacteroides sp. PF5-13]MDH6321186.1 putative P-loop ATPase [Parabacteroides sp. PH5-13]MDH6324918.1 putative P-loop ATPase [Parabacteroides sp. PH5-8]MDH6328558.1 putative P-loop ATPase [Parabacteroides sp. PH5-41]
MKVNFFTKFHRNEGSSPVMDILSDIKNGRYADPVTNLQKAMKKGEQASAEAIKKSLPAFTLSATYSARRVDTGIIHYNGVLILDIDKLEANKLKEVKEKAIAIPHTLFCFRSPGGKGLKIGVLPHVSHPVEPENHRKTFQVVQQYYEELLDIQVDPSGKDIGRLCFVSYDPELYINPLHAAFLRGETDACLSELPLMDSLPPINKKLSIARKQTTRRMKYEEGNRNNYLFHFANNCNRLGLPAHEVIAYSQQQFPELSDDERLGAIHSAYRHKGEHALQTEQAEDKSISILERIEQHLEERYKLRYNIVTHRVEYKRKSSNQTHKSMNDRAENSIWRELVKKGIKCKQHELNAVLYSDFCTTYDPFVTYFNSLPKWDGQTDHIAHLADTVTTTKQDLWHRCFRKWLVAMVACATQEDKENHTVLILKSEQGKGKTSWCTHLIPPELKEYRYSGALNPYSKDSLITLSECIFVNFDELGSLSTREMNKLKELITKGVVRERLPYGRNPETLIRRASCAGSVNDEQVFEDLTGSRRFLCFEALKIDYMAPVDYQNVYSQAVTLLKSGFQYWLSEPEIQEINSNNEDFRIRTPEEELLFTYIRKPEQKDEKKMFLTASEILRHMCLKSSMQITKRGTMTISTTLKKHGFRYSQARKGRIFEVVVLTEDVIEEEQKSNSKPPHTQGTQGVIGFSS